MAKARKPKKPDHLKRVLAALEAGDTAPVRGILAELHPADIARILEGLPPEPRATAWGQVDIQHMGEVLLELPEAVRVDLVKLMDDKALVAAARALDTDDIADLIPDLSDEVIAEILFALDKQDRQRLDAVLSYPDDTAGGLMNVDAITVRENITLEVVLRYLRRRDELPEHTNRLFVVDRSDRLAGDLKLTKLLTAEPKARVSQVMEREVVKFTALTPDKDVAAAFESYNLISAPVVDENNRLLGRITVDDVVDVIREQADRQVMAPAGLSEDQDIFAPVARSSRRRGIWLGINLVTAFIASWVIGLFEQTIQQVVALAVLMPIVASMGGNAGTQTLTLVVRGLAVGTISESNARRLLSRELMIGAVNGLVWALVVAAVAVWWYGNLVIGALIAAAMIINLAFAALSGVGIPFLVRRLGVDPALASGVILTTVTDVVGFFAFLGLATLFLI
ncbi:MAG: magnesium transporter [Candidatus Muproteobacteria bacterium RIFCSPHIGHO2_12_FULL_60_33]|uniref:Magnesium transporter MgtE n=1 Tax=Candidatus Muproteobacteria bacterium RIFCSPLOWO2_01_FULL_60_18 TaxID=1817768 RepID=A0A1F6U0F9_9PROT|nr:MAG: magnesium transporter [Candidatus Muproteobacteria bacterium RIFCSPLOWO2_01_FULL_60_18]OGI55504.1 MAG: magnesium transporter [Candidatus Muproteobacteria bacterium RIFCSPHIGHO2_12_FULL_60_33]